MPTVMPGIVTPLSPDSGILGCINEHDGSGFVHALLEACHPAYSQLRSEHYRTHLAKSVRIGALPTILRDRYGADPLSSQRSSESKAVFNQAVAYGSPIPSILLRNYAEYLGVSYRLYDADLELMSEYEAPSGKTPCHIIATTEDEYHLIVRLLPRRRGDKNGSVQFRVFDPSLEESIRQTSKYPTAS